LHDLGEFLWIKTDLAEAKKQELRRLADDVSVPFFLSDWQSLRNAEYRDPFRLENYGAVHVEDLQELFLLHRPQIVHFSGHGKRSFSMFLVNDSQRLQSLPEDLETVGPVASRIHVA
jgi:hypothetical protein